MKEQHINNGGASIAHQQNGEFDRVDIHNHVGTGGEDERYTDMVPVKLGRTLRKRVERAAARDGMARGTWLREMIDLIIQYDEAAYSYGLPMTDVIDDALALYHAQAEPEARMRILKQIAAKFMLAED